MGIELSVPRIPITVVNLRSTLTIPALSRLTGKCRAGWCGIYGGLGTQARFSGFCLSGISEYIDDPGPRFADSTPGSVQTCRNPMTAHTWRLQNRQLLNTADTCNSGQFPTTTPT